MSKKVKERGEMEKKILFAAGLIILIFVGLRSFSAHFFSIKDHACFTGDTLSDSQISYISEYISRDEHKKISPQILIDQIKKEIPVIKKMEMLFKPAGVQVMLEPYEPLCSINDMFVFTS